MNKNLKTKIQLILMSIDYLKWHYDLYDYGLITQEQLEQKTGYDLIKLQEVNNLNLALKNCTGFEDFPEIPNWIKLKFNLYNDYYK